MGLLPILLLFSYCFSGSAVPVPATDVDCDDENIFNAVAEALKSYNEAKVDGNKFILYRITEAKIKQENDSLTHQFVNFEIRESVCPLKIDTSWKQCDFKAEDAERGECSAHILVNTAQNTKTVLSKNCYIIPTVTEPPVRVVTAQCLGCYQPIGPNNEELSTILPSAMKNVNRILNHPFYFELENVTKAERKVISGWMYNLELNIIQTSCSMSLFSSGNTEECTIDINGDRGHCLSKVKVTPQGEINDILSECYFTGFCLHCPVAVKGDDPEIQALIQKFIEQYNLGNHTKLYNMANFTEATRKMDAQKKQYNLKFIIKATNCSKSDHAVLEDECAIEQDSIDYTCNVNIDVVNETANILPGYECLIDKARRISVKGFSPLRMAEPKRGRRASEISKGRGHGPNKEEKHEKNDKKEKKEHKKKKEHEKKKEHKRKKDRSSEESEEDHRKKPKVPPSLPGFEIPRVPEGEKVTQRPIVTEKITRQPSLQSATPFIPELPSSSQSAEGPNNQGTLKPELPSFTLAPAIPDYKGTPPTIDETVLDFPVLLPPNTSKCPGKVWKPLLIIPKFAEEEPFIIGGLSQAVDDLAPPEDQNQSSSLNTNDLFTNEDLFSLLDF